MGGWSYRLTHVGPFVRFICPELFSKIFQKLGTKLQDHNGHKLTKPAARKNLVRLKIYENQSNSFFLRISREVQYRKC